MVYGTPTAFDIERRHRRTGDTCLRVNILCITTGADLLIQNILLRLMAALSASPRISQLSQSDLEHMLYAQRSVMLVHSSEFTSETLETLAQRVEDADPDAQMICAALSSADQTPSDSFVFPRAQIDIKTALRTLNVQSILFLGIVPSSASLVAAHQLGIPIAAAHIRKQDLPTRPKFWNLSRQLIRFRALDAVFMIDGTLGAAARYLRMPHHKFLASSDIRHSSHVVPLEAETFAPYQSALMHRSVWSATHVTRGDLRHILKAHTEVMQRDFRALLILKPRDPQDVIACKAYLNEADIDFCLASGAVMPTDSEHVLLDDTGTQPGLWHQLAQSSFVGGSFDDIALPAETHSIVARGSAVIYGPKLKAFQTTVNELVRQRVARQVSNPHTLALAILDLCNVDIAAAQTVKAWDYATQADDAMNGLAQWMLSPNKPPNNPQGLKDENSNALVS